LITRFAVYHEALFEIIWVKVSLLGLFDLNEVKIVKRKPKTMPGENSDARIKPLACLPFAISVT
jgi:hypothetical protein